MWLFLYWKLILGKCVGKQWIWTDLGPQVSLTGHMYKSPTSSAVWVLVQQFHYKISSSTVPLLIYRNFHTFHKIDLSVDIEDFDIWIHSILYYSHLRSHILISSQYIYTSLLPYFLILVIITGSHFLRLHLFTCFLLIIQIYIIQTAKSRRVPPYKL